MNCSNQIKNCVSKFGKTYESASVLESECVRESVCESVGEKNKFGKLRNVL